MRLTEEICYDMSQFYPLKGVLEQLFGKNTYDRLKETANLRDWKVETTRLLKAIEIAIAETVRVADETWHGEIHDILELGRKEIGTSKSVTALFSYLSATLTRLVFTQIGLLPTLGRWHRDRVVPLRRKYWKLDAVRTVQYVQSIDQRQTLQRRLRKGAEEEDRC
jgi:hypothetical protein